MQHRTKPSGSLCTMLHIIDEIGDKQEFHISTCYLTATITENF